MHLEKKLFKKLNDCVVIKANIEMKRERYHGK